MKIRQSNKHIWIVSVVLILLLATVPAMALKVISDVSDYRDNPDEDPVTGVGEWRICTVQLDRWNYARIYYSDDDGSDHFTHGADDVRYIRNINVR